MLLGFAHYPNRTIIENVTMPLFNINNIKSFRWVTESELPYDLSGTIRRPDSGWLSFAGNVNPLTYENFPGAAALLGSSA